MNRNELRNLATEYGFSLPVRVGGQPAYADMGTLVSAGASIVGGMMSADASENASNAQLESNAQAIAEQRRQYDQNRADLAPWRNSGSAAANRLALLMGLSGYESGWKSGQLTAPTREQFMRPGGPTQTWQMKSGEFEGGWGSELRPQLVTGESSPVFDDAGYSRAMADYEARRAAGSASPDPEFGSLTRKFTMSDRDADPVYQSGLQFGLDEGTGAINARAMALGGYDSGATLKALTRFANDYGSTKANESRNRFVSDQDSIYNRLAGISGSGQTSTAQTVAAGSNMANNVSGMMTDAGNARAAGIVGGANAWSGAMSGVNNAYNNYQTNETLKKILADRNPYSMSNPTW